MNKEMKKRLNELEMKLNEIQQFIDNQKSNIDNLSKIDCVNLGVLESQKEFLKNELISMEKDFKFQDKAFDEMQKFVMENVKPIMIIENGIETRHWVLESYLIIDMLKKYLK